MNIWKLFREMEGLQKNLEEVTKGLGLPGFPKISFLSGLYPRTFPQMNLSEDDNNLYLEALAPGIDPDSLNLSVTRNNLTISGTKGELKMDTEHVHRQERIGGKFSRSIDLPVTVDSSKIAAEYKNGLLLVAIPKAEEAKPHQIKVNIG